MDIQSELSPQPERQHAPYERVTAWAVAQAEEHIQAVLPSFVGGTAVNIDIPLDHFPRPDSPLARSRPEAVDTVYQRREPIRRDSLYRREALLKGREGSRRRQRWENDRLMSNPYAQLPLPSDWQVSPTYPVHRVPYVVLPLYEAEYERYEKERLKRAEKARAAVPSDEAQAAKVAKELRARLKRSKGAKGLLHDLEEEVRTFVRQWDEKQAEMEQEGEIEAESEDEEMVFVGRDGTMFDHRRRANRLETVEKDKLIFQSLLDDHGAGFGRYLVHAIAAYYGLKTWSVTTGNPAWRLAYVGLGLDSNTRRPSLTRCEMPRPLYAVV